MTQKINEFNALGQGIFDLNSGRLWIYPHLLTQGGMPYLDGADYESFAGEFAGVTVSADPPDKTLRAAVVAGHWAADCPTCGYFVVPHRVAVAICLVCGIKYHLRWPPVEVEESVEVELNKRGVLEWRNWAYDNGETVAELRNENRRVLGIED